MRFLIYPAAAATLATVFLTLMDSFLCPPWNVGYWIRRVWQRALLARRADRSSFNLAVRLLSGERSGSIHSKSTRAGSNKWPCGRTLIFSCSRRGAPSQAVRG
jgi:hypothetical protein